MPMKSPVVLPLVCLSLVGCRSPFDGTWLFQWALASEDVQSNCDLEGETVQTRGDDYEWIDIYTTAGGALVLTNGAQEYVGTWSGDTLDVEATYGEQTASTYMSWNDTIQASLSDKDLIGDRTLQVKAATDNKKRLREAAWKMEAKKMEQRHRKKAGSKKAKSKND